MRGALHPRLTCTARWLGAPKALGGELTANPALEACRMFPDDPISYYSDEINI